METQVGLERAGDLAALAEEGFLFGYPLVRMATERENAAVNQFQHDAEGFTAWLDLSKEPVVLSVPDASRGDWTLSLMSAWREVFAGPDMIAAGTKKMDYAIVGPNWKGTLPAGLTEFSAPTEIVRITGKIQAGDQAQIDALKKALRLTPLSVWGKAVPKRNEARETVAAPSPAAEIVARMNGLTFFTRLSQLLVGNPPPATQEATLMRLQALGMKVGKPFRPDATTRAALDAGVKSGLAKVR